MQISSNTQPTMDTEEESLSAEERESFASSAEGPPLKELITEEFELGDRSDLEISHWWKTLTLISYFVTGVSGLATSIALGDVLAAFQNRCILYAKIGLINMDDFDGYKLTEQNIAGDKWGDTYDCEFCEFASLFSVIFSGMLFAMFLQCGRGGITSKGLRRSWEFVPLALLITAIFFIIGTVIFAKTIGGFAYFCDYIVRDSNSPGNITNCPQVLGYHFPWDDHGTNLYTEYVLAHVGATLTFAGWFASLIILIFRCLLGIDFVVYRKRVYANVNRVAVSSSKSQRKTKKSVRFLVDSQNKKASSSSSHQHKKSRRDKNLIRHDDGDESDETSFTTFDVTVETKKLI